MSAKGSKRTNEGSRKKKVREENDINEIHKPKKSKVKNEVDVDFSAPNENEAVEEIGGKNIKQKDAPHSSGKEEQPKEQSKSILFI